MKTIDLDTLSTITGGTAYQPLDLSMPPLGRTIGRPFPGTGPTIYNPRPSDILGGPGPTKPVGPNPLNPYDGIMNRR